VVLCAAIQAAALMPLWLGAPTSLLPITLVFTLASIYWGAGMAGSPAWNTWVGILVPCRLRARFFARRTRLSQAGLLAGFLIGGIGLQIGDRMGKPLVGFAFLFFAAVASRMVSAFFLSRQRDAHYPGKELLTLQVHGLLGSLKNEANGRLLMYLLAAQAAVQISSPYFTPYMLGQLEMSYLTYVVLSSTAYVAKILCLPALGRLADRWGTTQLLWNSALAIAPLPAFWLVSDSPIYLFVLQIYSGAVWAGFELAMLLLFFESIPAEKRIAILTIFNFANAAAIVLGSLLGGAILAFLGASREVYWVIFLASSVARGVALLLLVRLPQVSVKSVPIPTRPLAMRPSLGSMERPVLAGLNHSGGAYLRRDNAEKWPRPALVRVRDRRWRLTFAQARPSESRNDSAEQETASSWSED
jgi:hypothetical protein